MTPPTDDRTARERAVEEARLNLRGVILGLLCNPAVTAQDGVDAENALVRAARLAERHRVREAVEKEHAVILRDVGRWGWNVNKQASNAALETALAAIDALPETP
jgi:hypothetical protein